jgi:CHAT domain
VVITACRCRRIAAAITVCACVGVWLRVDREVRDVKQRLRGSRYRDLVELEHKPAADFSKFVDGLNDHRPHVVHFSGHAHSGGIILEACDDQNERDFPFDQLARLLGATTDPPQLVVPNACESLDGADELLQIVPVVIGMADTIDDAAAIVFASYFYGAIAATPVRPSRPRLGEDRDGTDLSRRRDAADYPRPGRRRSQHSRARCAAVVPRADLVVTRMRPIAAK